MAIEDIKTKADLERFLDERLQGLSLNQVAGLPEAMAARTAERFSLEANRSPVSNVEEPLKGCKYTAPENMTALAIGTIDAELGFTIGHLWVAGVQREEVIIANISNRATVSQSWPIILSKGDVVELKAAGNGAGTIYQKHTALTILRLS